MNPLEPDPDFAARPEAKAAKIDMLLGHRLSHYGQAIGASFGAEAEAALSPFRARAANLPAAAHFVSYRRT